MAEALAGRDHPDDLDGLACHRQRRVEPDAVPSLHDLRPARPDAEPEPAPGELLHRHGRHRQHGGGAGAELRNRGSECDPLGSRRQIGERCEGVLAPRLGDPDGADADALSLANEVRVFPRGNAACNADLHLRYSVRV